jgi:1,4-alpha-glucan branching enzyme
LASWKRPDANDRESFYNYREIAEQLVPYVTEMGFTHVELMPVMEHPFDGSWGYQITGYFAPTSRYGSVDDFKYLVECLHKAGIGLILDWVPSHFPFDAHGLYRFDGSHVYEYADMRKGFQPDWNSYVFNYARAEVRSFLLSNAHYWLEEYHADGLRVDAVASMIHLNFSRSEGNWEPNVHGGHENLEAIAFLRLLNTSIYERFPDVQTIAEESTTFFGVSHPIQHGGLGFGMKWMMGWMNDTLDYFKLDPYLRKWHHNQITFSIMYAFTENFMLPLSHDEVVHGKSPMIYKMPGDDWQRFANLRLLYAYMFTHPGTKLLFMGNEFGDTKEWDFASALQWDLLQHPTHKGLQLFVQALNKLYRKEKPLYELSFDPSGFEWIHAGDTDSSVLIYARKDKKGRVILVALNMTPVPREDYQFRIPWNGTFEEIFNSDDPAFYGSGVLNEGKIKPVQKLLHLRLPPLGAVILKGSKIKPFEV